MRGRISSSSGGGSGALVVQSDHIFADATARDAYFTAHPTELVEGLPVVTGSELQKYISGSFVDFSVVVRGQKGDPGEAGKTWYSGSGVPSSESGVVGDFYLDTLNSVYYGPKTESGWGTGTSILGETGSAGTDGKTWHSGSGVPSSGTGVDGDFYLDTTNSVYYGPKSSGAWPEGVSIIGADGSFPVINTLTEKTSPNSNDLLILEDSEATFGQKKVKIGNLPTGGGGEANTASNLGTSGDGEGLYSDKSGIDLRFKRIKAGTNVTLTSETNDIVINSSGGGVTDHGDLTGLSDNDHPQYLLHSLATAVNDFLVSSASGIFVKKTLAEVKTILGLGGAAYLNVGTTSGDVAAGNRGLPSGGTEGQIIKKVDGTNFNVTWGDPIDADALVYKGAINCSTNPNYPAADAGDTYKVSAAGKIGGASGPSVAVGDLLICSVNSTASGDHATVGANWSVIGATTEGVVVGPTSSVNGNLASFDGTSGGAIQDSGYAPSDFCADDDSRLSNARTPTSHASSHISTGSDPIATAVASGASGLMSGSDKTKLDGIASGANNYSLPTASSGVLGGIKVGSRLTITDGVLSADEQGGSYTLPTASADTLGGVKIGSGITITDGVISASGGGGGITWNEVTGTSQTAAADNGYIANNSSLVTITLPATCAIGKTIRIAGKGAGMWKVAQNAGQTIYFGDQNSTSGTAGYIAARYQYDAVELLCITANTTFLVIGNVGNLDVI